MKCKRIQKGDLDAYIHGELSSAETGSLEAHLFGCAHCATELRHLRQEKRFFRARADADTEPTPSFESVLARIAREEHHAEIEAQDPDREVAIANVLRPIPVASKVERARHDERKHVVPRWAQTLVACAATAAAAVSLIGVTPAKTERVPAGYSYGNDLDIGAEPVCVMENGAENPEILASWPTPHEVQTESPRPNVTDSATCDGNDHDPGEPCDAPPDEACNEPSLSMCGENGP